MAGQSTRWYNGFRQSFAYSLMMEALGVIGMAATLFSFFSLISYNQHDPSNFYMSTQHMPVIANWCGMYGASLSAALIYLFGMISYFIIFMVAGFSYALLRASTMRTFYWAIGASVCAIPLLCTLCRLTGLDWYIYNPGGIVGYSGAQFFVVRFGVYGSLVMIGMLLWILGLVACMQSISQGCAMLLRTIIMTARELMQQGVHAYQEWHAYINDQQRVIKCLLSSAHDGSEQDALGVVSNQNSIGHHVAEMSMTPALETTYGAAPSVGQSTVQDNENVMRFREYSLQNMTYYQSFMLGKNIIRLPNSVMRVSIFSDLVQKLKQTLLQQKLQPAVAQTTKITGPSVEYRLPDVSVFATKQAPRRATQEYEIACKERAKRLEEKLFHFGVKGSVTAIRPGPVITLFEYKPDIDTKISKIIALEDDLALALKALSIRIIAPIPGRNVVGFEIANEDREQVLLHDIFMHESFTHNKHILPLVLGSDIIGNPVIEDLVTMPHLLVAGSTGSGKSVGLNAMLMSLLCKRTPEELRLILVDPKRLEFAPYHNIGHLLFPILTNPRKVAPILKWLVQEMETRYEMMSHYGVRNLIDYRAMLTSLRAAGHDAPNVPFIVLVVDELADLMMVAGKEIEQHIARLAQMARAAGIHIILATQRPSVDVITGIIKVNFPSRIGYRVSSKIDSKTILDTSGSEKLLGRGDMLYMNARLIDLQRVHGAYVSDDEILKLTNYIRSYGPPEYLDVQEELARTEQQTEPSDHDELYHEVHEFVRTQQEISISMLQRKYRIGFNRSARLIEQLELDGILAPAQGSKPRKVIR